MASHDRGRLVGTSLLARWLFPLAACRIKTLLSCNARIPDVFSRPISQPDKSQYTYVLFHRHSGMVGCNCSWRETLIGKPLYNVMRGSGVRKKT
ncbi:uncharacterized protein K489DRAFT_381261 [Dissoconium aciculare CBS 342.82]|uniref:Secreted protein n=1 Tax=Dissoconium aciculare CBS 342.82 TaxID=1314786 RepID=A0A6J3M381_9PEZI|nr:uncharacterized protein K489DRAFT_381261 [Dissoconium aciculare CBS 342.82]KAF1822491.1 hypothetical protein K489DRAFT_381261 [Dissoconium aciculare CBS 342.82]